MTFGPRSCEPAFPRQSVASLHRFMVAFASCEFVRVPWEGSTIMKSIIRRLARSILGSVTNLSNGSLRRNGSSAERLARRHGNGFERLEDRLLLVVYQDARGWTVVDPSADTRTIYVSNSTGNDANDG